MNAQHLTLQAGPSAMQSSSQKSATAAGNISMAMVAQSLQSKWQSMLTQQGAKVPVEELLEEGLFGNVSNVTSRMTSPMGSALQASSDPGQKAPLLGRHFSARLCPLRHLSPFCLLQNATIHDMPC